MQNDFYSSEEDLDDSEQWSDLSQEREQKPDVEMKEDQSVDSDQSVNEEENQQRNQQQEQRNKIKNRQAYFGGLPMTATHTHFKELGPQSTSIDPTAFESKNFSSNQLLPLIS